MIYEMFVHEDEWQGGAMGGFYVRTAGLPKFLKTMREKGFKPVGMVVDDEDENNVEVVLALNETLIKHIQDEGGDKQMQL